MIHNNIELYNVNALLSGDIRKVMDASMLEWLRANALPGDYALWMKEPDDGLWLTRIPSDLRKSMNPNARVAALRAAGSELRFNLRSASARITLRCALRPAIAEVYQGPFLMSWHIIGVEPTMLTLSLPQNLSLLERTVAEHHLPYDARLTRVVLPYGPPVRLLTIEGEFGLPAPQQTPARKCLCYGSSITNGSAAVHPSATYASRLAWHLGVDLINLGFGGGAWLEPEIADYIASRTDWDFATLEMGINVVGRFSVEEFAARVNYFVPTIARAHPNKWVFCMDLFTCDVGAEGNAKVVAFRRVVHEAVRNLNMDKVVYVPGPKMLTSPAGLTFDLVHPAPAGMEEIALHLARTIRRRLG